MTAALTWTRARPLGACFAALLAGAVLARYGLGAAGLIAAATTAVLVVLSLIDAESHRLPNRLVLPSAALVLAARLATEPGALAGVARREPRRVRLLPRFRTDRPGGHRDGRREADAAARRRARRCRAAGAAARGASGRRSRAVVVLVREGRGARRKAIPYGPFLAFGAIALMLLHAA